MAIMKYALTATNAKGEYIKLYGENKGLLLAQFKEIYNIRQFDIVIKRTNEDEKELLRRYTMKTL